MNNVVLKYVQYFLLILILIYFSQGVLYPFESFIAKVALFLTLLISGIFFLKIILTIGDNNTFVIALIFLIGINIFSFLFSTYAAVDQLKYILISLLPFFSFYYFAQKGVLTKKILLVFFFSIIPLFILSFFIMRTNIMIDRMIEDEATVVNNIAYNFVFVIPFIFLFKQKRIISSLMMFLLLFFIIQGAKRGALLAGVIGMVFFIYHQFKTIEKKHRFRGFVLSLMGVTALVWVFIHFYQSNEFLLLRMADMEQGAFSGRDRIYNNIFNSWKNSDLYQRYLFGFGFGASRYLSGTYNYAHNDWLELLSGFGFLGVFIYLNMFLSGLRFGFNKRIDKDKRITMNAVLAVWFFVSLVSMNYSSPNGLFQSMILGYLFGTEKENLKFPKIR